METFQTFTPACRRLVREATLASWPQVDVFVLRKYKTTEYTFQTFFFFAFFLITDKQESDILLTVTVRRCGAFSINATQTRWWVAFIRRYVEELQKVGKSFLRLSFVFLRQWWRTVTAGGLWSGDGLACVSSEQVGFKTSWSFCSLPSGHTAATGWSFSGSSSLRLMIPQIVKHN